MIINQQYYYIFWIIFDAIIISFLIIQLVLSIVQLNSLKVEDNAFTEVYDNLSQQVLESIKPSNSNGDCPDGYSPLIFGTWPGTDEGCYCGSEKKYYKGKCTREMFTNSCVNKPPIKKRLITKWRGTIICARYYDPDLIYFTFLQDSIKNSSCILPSVTKSCGYLDNLNHTFCVAKDLSCPISDIVINNQPTYHAQGYTYDKITLNDGYYFHYTNKNPNASMITTFTLSEEKPCMLINEFASEKEPFLLERNTKKHVSNCKKNKDYGDENYYTKIGTIEKFTLYSDNKIYKDITANELLKDGYEEIINDSISLYKQSYFGIHKKCLYGDNLINSYLFSIVIYDQKHKPYTIAIISFIFVCLLYQLLLVVFKVFVNYKIKPRYNWCELGIICLHLLILIFAAVFHKNIEKEMDFNKKCVDSYIGFLYDEGVKNGYNIKKYSLTTLLLSLISMLLFTANLIFRYCQNKKKVPSSNSIEKVKESDDKRIEIKLDDTAPVINNNAMSEAAQLSKHHNNNREINDFKNNVYTNKDNNDNQPQEKFKEEIKNST